MSLVLRFRALTRGVRQLPTIASALVACALAQPAEASGPVEAFVQVLLDESNPQRIVLRYSNTSSRTGLVYSLDGGKTFGLLCTGAVGEAALSQPGAPAGDDATDLSRSITRPLSAAMTGSGITLLASTVGLVVDDGSGCDWEVVEEVFGAWIDAVAAHPTEPHAGYAITNGLGSGGNEGLWRRNQDGSATRLGTMPGPRNGFDSVSFDGLVLAPRPGGVRLYTTALHSRLLDGSYSFQQYVLSSDDEGESFSEHAAPEVSEGSFSLLAVDPTNAERVVAVITRNDDQNRWDSERDTIMVSHDGGATFNDYLEVTAVGAAMFSPDGTLWIGDAGKTTSGELPVGLYRGAPGLASAPEKLTDDQPVTCLGQRTGESSLYVCRRFEFGTFNPTDKAFTRLVDTLGVQQFLSCGGRDLPAQCHPQLCVSGWCGPGHFAKAPFCGAYDEPSCGNHVWIEDETDAGALPDADSGASLDAGSVPGGDAGVGGQIPQGDAGVGRSKSGSDCSLRVGPGLPNSGLGLWGALLGGLTLARRFRRAKAPRRKS